MQEIRSGSLLALFLVALFGLQACSASRIYYVDQRHPRAQDTNPGSESRPLETLGATGNLKLAPGDKVIVKAGIYDEPLIITSSGAPDRPIVFEGVRGGKGQWLTIIDPSQEIAGAWQLVDGEGSPGVLDPEKGPTGCGVIPAEDHREVRAGHRVFKRRLGFEPHVMLVERGEAILRLKRCYMTFATLSQRAFATDWGEPHLLGLGALYGYDPVSKFTYIRFRDGRDPGGERLWASSNGDSEINPVKPAIQLHDVSHVVVRDFRVRGTYYGISLAAAKKQRPQFNVVESNLISYGFTGISLAGTASDNTVRDNEVSFKQHGRSETGAWVGGDSPEHRVRRSLFLAYRGMTQVPTGIRSRGMGMNNTVCGNHVHSGITGLEMIAWQNNIKICHNMVRNMSHVGVLIREGQVNAEIADNQLLDNNHNLRLHHFDHQLEDTKQRRIFLYRNQLWLAPGVGRQIFVHYGKKKPDTCGEVKGRPHVFAYHNTLVGGEHGLYNSSKKHCDTLDRVAFVNNVIAATSDAALFMGSAAKPTFERSARAFGCFEHNWTEDRPNASWYVGTGWYGKTNITGSTPVGGYPDDFSSPAFSAGFLRNAWLSAIDQGTSLEDVPVCRGWKLKVPAGLDTDFSGKAPDMGADER